MPILRKIAPPNLAADPQPCTREEAITRLLARGLTLAEIQAEDERAAAHHAKMLARARHWAERAGTPAAALQAPAPVAPVTPTPTTTPVVRARYHIRNWRQYNQALVRRGSLTLWLDEDTLQMWCQNTRDGQVGSPITYGNTTIQAILTLRAVFSLALRQTQGFVAHRRSLNG